MENHATRPEFAAALQGQVGTSTRLSKTVNVELLYVAVPIPGGAVRMAYPLNSIREANRQIRRDLLEGSALAGLLALLLAFVATQSHWTTAAAHHRFRRAGRGRRSVGANSGRVERRDCARGFRAR